MSTFGFVMFGFLLYLLTLIGHSASSTTDVHPFYVSVTHIDHNSKERRLEISCRIFTDDFEKTLRKNHSGKVDLLNAKQKEISDSLIAAYLVKHLSIRINSLPAYMNYIGYEQDEEAVRCYLEVDDIESIREVSITNSILYDYQEKQVSLIYFSAGGVKKSTRLTNPEDTFSFRL